MVIFLNSIVLFSILIAYYLYKEFQDYRYRQKLFEIREELFLTMLEKRIDFKDKDYKYLENRINLMIKNSESYRFIDTILLIFLLSKNKRKKEILSHDYEYKFQNKKIKKWKKRYFLKQ